MIVGRRHHPISVGNRSLPDESRRVSTCASVLLREANERDSGHTEPVFNERLVHGARCAISQDFKERGTLSPAEAVGEPRQCEVGVGGL